MDPSTPPNPSTSPSQATLALPVESSKPDTPKDVQADTPKPQDAEAPPEKRRKDGADVQVQPAGKAYKHMSEAERQEYLSDAIVGGEAKYHQLGWLQLVVILIVEAIALGALSLPNVFATLGMVCGTILTVGIGLIAIYTSYVVGQVKLKYPQVVHYSDIGSLLGGPRFGVVIQSVIGTAFVVYLVLLVGSHCLTGTIAFKSITGSDICAIIFGVVSMILLLLCAVPPSFAEMAVLGYIDFVSIIAAIIITLVATGVTAHKQAGGMAAVDWSAWPREDTTFASAIVAVTNIVFAYSFAICQFSFMEEMHTPKDFPKSVWVLGITEIVIYTLTGALGYAFVGTGVKAPALLSAGHTVSRVAFGVALPVIFISGSINTVTAGRYILDKLFRDSMVRYVNTARGWAVWLTIITVISVVAFVIAESIPFFSDLLGIISSLFISGFSFYLPGIMWLVLIREGGCFQGWKNSLLTLLNVGCIAIGLICLGPGTYGAVREIILKFDNGTFGKPWAC